MRKLCPILLFIAFVFSVNTIGLAQVSKLSPTDSLEQVAKTTKDTTKVIALFKLSHLYLYNQPDKALAKGKEALALAEKLNYLNGIAGSKNNLGNYYYQTGDYKKALVYHKEALILREQKNDIKGVAMSNLNIANAYYGQGKLKEAITVYYKALKYAEQIKRDDLVTMIYSNVGIIYFDLKNFDKALEVNFKAIKIRENNKDIAGLAFSYNSVGMLYLEQKKYELAKLYFNKTAVASAQSDNKSMSAYALNNIGEIYSRQGNYKPAELAQEKALAIREELGDKLGMAGSLNNLTIIYIATGDLNRAEQYCQKMLTIGKQTKSYSILLDAYKGLTQIAEKKKEYPRALSFYKQHAIYRDSLINEESSKQLTALNTKYETDKKEQAITLLTKERKIKDLQLARQNLTLQRRNMLLLASGLVFLVLLIAVYLYYTRQKLRAKLLALEAVQKVQQERERISSDLHDHVGAQLTSIISGLEMTEHFDDLRNNAKVKILVDSLKEDARTTMVNLRDTIWTLDKEEITAQELIERVEKFAHTTTKYLEKPQYHIKSTLSEDVVLVPTKALHLVRLLEEAIHNIIKHAQADNFYILFRQVPGNKIYIEIMDDGCGFDQNQTLGSDHYGLKNMQRRATEAATTCEIISQPGNGTVIKIIMPI